MEYEPDPINKPYRKSGEMYPDDFTVQANTHRARQLIDSAQLQRDAAIILREAAATFQERNAVYGSNYRMVAPIMKVLWPQGVPSALVTTHRWHLFELMVVKMSRFAISGLTHQDSIRDLAVYAAMVESLIGEDQS